MHPTDQMSIGGPYSFSNKISSGALYHLVTTWPVSSLLMFFLWSLVLMSFLASSFFFCYSSTGFLFSSSFISSSCCYCFSYSYCYIYYEVYSSLSCLSYFVMNTALSTPAMLRAKPKSQILTLQSSLTKIFAGLRSLWRTLAAWRYLTAQSKL